MGVVVWGASPINTFRLCKRLLCVSARKKAAAGMQLWRVERVKQNMGVVVWGGSPINTWWFGEAPQTTHGGAIKKRDVLERPLVKGLVNRIHYIS